MNTQRPSAPVYLSIAGSDCSSGAGIQADLKAGCALGCYPLTAITCVVSEVPGKVAGLTPLEPDFVAGQVRICLEHFPVRAIKTGMLYSPAIVEAVAAELADKRIPLVIDPVMIATAGEPLMLQAAIRSYEEQLFPLATVITPNLDELERLLGCQRPQDADRLREAAQAMAHRYHCAVLAKGGHLNGNTCTDVLALPTGEVHQWEHPRSHGVSTHGTGCTLSSALAAGLAGGNSLVEATQQALRYVSGTISHALRLGKTDALHHMYTRS